MNRFNRLVCAVVLVSFILNTALSDIAIADLLPAKPIASSRTATLGVPSGLDDITGVVRQDRQRIDALTRLGLIQAADKNTGRIDMAHFADIVRALKDPNFKTQVVVSPDTIEILPEGHLSVLCKVREGGSDEGAIRYRIVFPQAIAGGVEPENLEILICSEEKYEDLKAGRILPTVDMNSSLKEKLLRGWLKVEEKRREDGTFKPERYKNPFDAFTKIIAVSAQLSYDNFFSVEDYRRNFNLATKEDISAKTARNDLCGKGLKGMPSLVKLGLINVLRRDRGGRPRLFRLSRNGRELLKSRSDEVRRDVLNILSDTDMQKLIPYVEIDYLHDDSAMQKSIPYVGTDYLHDGPAVRVKIKNPEDNNYDIKIVICTSRADVSLNTTVWNLFSRDDRYPDKLFLTIMKTLRESQVFHSYLAAARRKSAGDSKVAPQAAADAGQAAPKTIGAGQAVSGTDTVDRANIRVLVSTIKDEKLDYDLRLAALHALGRAEVRGDLAAERNNFLKSVIGDIKFGYRLRDDALIFLKSARDIKTLAELKDTFISIVKDRSTDTGFIIFQERAISALGEINAIDELVSLARDKRLELRLRTMAVTNLFLRNEAGILKSFVEDPGLEYMLRVIALNGLRDMEAFDKLKELKRSLQALAEIDAASKDLRRSLARMVLDPRNIIIAATGEVLSGREKKRILKLAAGLNDFVNMDHPERYTVTRCKNGDYLILDDTGVGGFLRKFQDVWQFGISSGGMSKGEWSFTVPGTCTRVLAKGNLIMAVLDDKIVATCNMSTGETVPGINNSYVSDIVCSPDSRRLVVIDYASGHDTLWDTVSVSKISTFSVENIVGCKFSPDSSRFLTVDLYGKVTMRDAGTGRIVGDLKDIAVKDIWGFSPDSAQVITGSTENNEAPIWDAMAGKKICQINSSKRYDLGGGKTVFKSSSGEIIFTVQEVENITSGPAVDVVGAAYPIKVETPDGTGLPSDRFTIKVDKTSSAGSVAADVLDAGQLATAGEIKPALSGAEERSSVEPAAISAEEAGDIGAITERLKRAMPTYEENRYTFILPAAFYANGEFREHAERYRDVFNLEMVADDNLRNFVEHVAAKAAGKKDRTVVLVPRQMIESCQKAPSRDGLLNSLTNLGIRFIVADINPAMNLRENDTARARFQLDIYATMRLARYINRGSPLYSNSQEALRAILESRFGMDTLAADEYINALLNDNVAVLIKNCLRYRPMVPQRADDDRERAVKALIAA